MKYEVVGTQAVGRHRALFSLGYSVDLKSCSRLIIISGQVSQDQNAQVVGRGNFVAQCEQVYKNLQTTLESAGATMANIVSLGTFLSRKEDLSTFHEWRQQAYPRIFPSGQYPPNTAVVVTSLIHPDLLLEIEAIAAI